MWKATVDGIPLERLQCFYSWTKACVKIKILSFILNREGL